jgi:hypothetical protein
MTVRVEDYGLRTERQIYGTPHGVALTFFGASNEPLASARSVEPEGYILAIHPDPGIGDCSKYQSAHEAYAECYARYSAWTADWARRVRAASVSIGACTLRDLPVNTYSSNADWWLWWVPLPHVGGTPRRYYELVVQVDTKSCTGVRPRAR